MTELVQLISRYGLPTVLVAVLLFILLGVRFNSATPDQGKNRRTKS